MILTSVVGQVPLVLPHTDKKAIQSLLERISAAPRKDREAFGRAVLSGQEPGWLRYINGIYNYPKTWWIGIIHTQMVMGVWGSRLKAQASLRQNTLARVLHQLVAEEHRDAAQDLIANVVRFNARYRKADIAGRLHGGVFTNYVLMGGRAGGKAVPRAAKWGVRVTNVTVASFGAAIQTVAMGLDAQASVLHAIITGNAEALPAGFRALVEGADDESVDELEELVQAELRGVHALNQVSPGPIPIKEFCSRPENVDLEALCK